MKSDFNEKIRDLLTLFHTKRMLLGNWDVFITAVVIISLILLNLIFQQLNLSYDLTRDKVFSITQETKDIIANIESPVQIIILHEPGNEPPELKKVISEYTQRNALITFHSLDPEREPGIFAKYQNDEGSIAPGALVVDGQNGYRIITSADLYDISYHDPDNPRLMGFSLEKQLTTALMYVSTGETLVVYELSGHNEDPLTGSEIQNIFERENFALKRLSLMVAEKVPADAGLLIINAPKTDITPGEAEKIITYLANGGRLLILSDLRAGDIPVLNDVLSSYGIMFNHGVAIEPDQNYNTGNPYQIRPTYSDHTILDPLSRTNIDIILQFACNIQIIETRRREIILEPLLISSSNSFLRKNLSNSGIQKIPGDIEGPLTLAIAIKDEMVSSDNKETRIVAIATGTLLDELIPFGQIPGNIQFFMNSISWLNNQPDGISIASRDMYVAPMRLSGRQMIIFSAFFIIVIPSLLFGTGLLVWLKRRHK